MRDSSGRFIKGPRPEIALDKNPAWKGGRYVEKTTGYIRIAIGNKKWIYEHRYIYEQFIGRKLDSLEHIHHLNHNKTDNRIENLQLIGRRAHGLLHMPGQTSVRLICENPSCKKEFSRLKCKAISKHHYCSFNCSRVCLWTISRKPQSSAPNNP